MNYFELNLKSNKNSDNNLPEEKKVNLQKLIFKIK